MQFQVKDHRIIASNPGQPLIGEISFPAVSDDRVVVERVFVHPDYQGQGIAAQLVQHFVDYAKEQHWTVKLMCPYAKAQFKQHPEYQELLLPKDRINLN
ncbi:GNAT family N-acetyltransferase [Limosilactobacillus oris]|uniref:GNAT family N-acetyltransferase n=1 Tax=Limosilactobacillus oris TaxID=1632 RepID=UPI0024BAA3B3|nr:GNAT family N-acetyltransferase [Limosilactobacillus oris]